MTFLTWWEEHKPGSFDLLVDGAQDDVKQAFASCWNAALDEGIRQVQPISQKIVLENLKVNRTELL
jgi:hypothetical protein